MSKTATTTTAFAAPAPATATDALAHPVDRRARSSYDSGADAGPDESNGLVEGDPTPTGPSAYAYLTRILPALSVVGVVLALVFSFGLAPNQRLQHGDSYGHAPTSQLILSVYTVVLHLMSILFPSRVCWALGDVTKRIAEAASVVDRPKKRKLVTVRNDDGAAATYPAPLFVVIIPNYKEEMETMEETLRVLASHAQARQCYDIYLAMEEKEENATSKAKALIQTFQKSFRRVCFTLHPAGIPGEAQGKSSNEQWAARQAFQDYPDELKKDIVMTTMDADTHLSTRYFAQVAKYHLECPESNEATIYVPPLVFDRNLHNVPLPVRTADLIWAGAGISSLYSGSRICIPTSVYSLPMNLVEHVGGWDTDQGAIGEDMHMYLKCFFATSGNLKVQIVYAAASSCNVSSDLKGFNGYVDGLTARYKQALRHMWGSLDTGFAIRRCASMLNRHIDSNECVRGKRPSAVRWLKAALDAVSSRCIASWSSEPRSSKSRGSKSTDSRPIFERPIHLRNVATLFQRLFEAHFLPVHLAVILTTSTVYDIFGSGAVSPELWLALQFSGYCRALGWTLMAVFFHRYEKYHRVCLQLRQREMLKAGMLEDITEHDGFSPRVSTTKGLIEAAVFPVGGFIFGAIPHCQAILSHIFTDRLTYHVSLKPQFALRQWRGGKQAR